MAEIVTANGTIFLIDDEDLNLVSSYSWSTTGDGRYAKAWGVTEQKFVQLHRVVMRASSSETVDHKEPNSTFDCRKSNLRIATMQQNQFNRGPNKNNKTGFKGVRKIGKRFASEYRLNGKTNYLGMFDTPEEAHEAYCKAVKPIHKEFFRSS